MVADENQLPEIWDPEAGDEDWGEQLLANSLDLDDNPEPRCPCVLALDSSRSMAGEPIAALNRGLEVFHQELSQSPLARQRVEIAVVTFGATVQVLQDFVSADLFRPPLLEARGETPLGAALIKGLDLIESRKVRYREAGISYYRPWLFLISDGMPQGEPWEVLRQAVQRIKGAEAGRKAAVFAVGVGGANMKLLARLSVRPTLQLQGLRFAELFTWLSVSTERSAQGVDPDQIALPPVDWKAGTAAARTGLGGAWENALNPPE